MDDLQQVLAGAEAMPDDGTERAEPGAEVEYASRTAQRKTERRAGRVVRRAEQRLKSAAVKREERAVVRAARAANSSPSPEEQAGYYAIRNARRAREEARDGLREGMSLPWSHPGSRGVRVVIDLGMEALMNTSELKSLAAQVTISYGEVIQRSIHREGYAPLRLACTGLADAPKTKARLLPKGAKGWGMHFCEGDFAASVTELCAPLAEPAVEPEAMVNTAGSGGPQGEIPMGLGPRIVVLSPDAEVALTEVREDEVYVIGGLCDYGRILNVTAQRAEERGVFAARLPISEAFGVTISVDILTINQVVVALMEVVNNGGDWEKAFREALPPRKLREVDELLKLKKKGANVKAGVNEETGAKAAADGTPVC